MNAKLMRLKAQQASDIKTEMVEVPEWDLTGENAVMVRGLTGRVREEYEQSCLRPGKPGRHSEIVYKDMKIKLVMLCSFSGGERVFMDGDESWLGEKSATALQKLYNVAAKLSALTAEDVDELAKNSKSVQGDDSISVLPLPSGALSENS